MQKRIYTSLLFFLTVFFITSSCGKYEDGPAFSLLSKKSRITNTWKIDKVFINDIDRTSIYAEYIKTYKLDLTKDGKLAETTTTTLGTVTVNGTWALTSSDENLVFTEPGLNIINKILKLKSSEMWLQKTDGNDTYVTHYITY